MAKKRKEKFEDDGRVIAPMNVEGMPWYVKKLPGQESSSQPDYLSPKERRKEDRAVMWGVLKAALLIGIVFAVGYAVIIFLIAAFVNR